MQLDNALELQLEIMRTLFDYTEIPNTTLAVPIEPKLPPLPVLMDPRAFDAHDRNLPYRPSFLDIAFGIGKTRHGFGTRSNTSKDLLVYCQDRSLLQSALIDKIVSRAPNEVKVIYTGRARQQSARMPPMIGDSVGHELVTAGSLGCYVKHKASGGIGFISNNHVLAAVNAAQIGDPILHPGRADGGTSPAAQLADRIELELGGQSLNYTDAAWAKMVPELTENIRNVIYDGTTEIGSLKSIVSTSVYPGEPVSKIGRTTKRTQGVIQSVGVNHLWVAMESKGLRKLARFDNQIVIEGAGEGAFSKGGDSGSIVFDEQFHPMALLFAGTEKGGTNKRGLTYASPVALALNGMDLSIFE